MRLTNGQTLDLSGVQVMGVYLMDMIGHNRESDWDIFQISPGKAGVTTVSLGSVFRQSIMEYEFC